MTSNKIKFLRRINLLSLCSISLLSTVSLATTTGKAKIIHNQTLRNQIIVAVIDTGLDTKHPLLKNNIWRNQGEVGYDSQGRDRRFNGIDDDNNGFIDDYQGWNFIDNNNQVTDRHGHGTHVSGLIVGTELKKNQESIPGSDESPILIMPLKYYDSQSDNEKTIQNTAKAIQYAVRMGAQIINYSGGGYQRSEIEFQSIRIALEKQIPFVAAAGNDHFNSDQIPFYPAAYNLENIISVGSSDANGQLDFFSNFGLQHVHIMAEGKSIRSTVPGGLTDSMTGTSQSAAEVSHVIAKILSLKKNQSLFQIKERLFKSQPKNNQLRKVASEAVVLNKQLSITQRNENEDAFDFSNDAATLLPENEEAFLIERLLEKKTENLK